jgi:hypothetical protein
MAKTSGLICAHGVELSLVTVMWSRPRKTEVTPSMLSSWAASGDGCGGARVERGFRYSRKGEDIDSGRTRWLGLNLRAYQC